jgi:hypothetical protein
MRMSRRPTFALILALLAVLLIGFAFPASAHDGDGWDDDNDDCRYDRHSECDQTTTTTWERHRTTTTAAPTTTTQAPAPAPAPAPPPPASGSAASRGVTQPLLTPTTASAPAPPPSPPAMALPAALPPRAGSEFAAASLEPEPIRRPEDRTPWIWITASLAGLLVASSFVRWDVRRQRSLG